MRRSLFLSLALALLAPASLGAAEPPASAHAHGGKSDKGGDRAAQSELVAQAAFDTKGVLWAVHKVSGHIAVSRSEDRGLTWLNPVLVTPAPEPTDTGGDARPKIALGPTGEIYVTWTKPLAKPYTGEIKFARSLDGGRTFSPPFVVHRDRQEITHRFDALAVTARGQTVVAWTKAFENPFHKKHQDLNSTVSLAIAPACLLERPIQAHLKAALRANWEFAVTL